LFKIIRNLTYILAFTSIVAGLFLRALLAQLDLYSPCIEQVRWVLMLGMPVLLVLSFIRLNLTPARTEAGVTLYFIAQLALFLAPFVWLSGNVL
jgi:hypothetical protein